VAEPTHANRVLHRAAAFGPREYAFALVDAGVNACETCQLEVMPPSANPGICSGVPLMQARQVRALAVSIGLTAPLVPSIARAYTFETPISSGCHESITIEALRAVRADVPPIAPDANERAMIEDLGFSVPADLADLSGVSMLHGVRDNDLKGRSILDLDEFALIHGDPNAQVEHCLRRPEDDSADGSRHALEACRGFILERALSAGDALDTSGRPDPNQRTDLYVSLTIRGRVSLRLPAFHVRIGQALHALQDGFTHTYRTADGHRVTAVLNWVDTVEDHSNEPRDGPGHSSQLDKCKDLDPQRAARRALAAEASAALLRAVLRPGDRTARADEIRKVLDGYFAYEPGCTADNGWCDAWERKFSDESAGCGLGRPGRWLPGSFVGVWVLGLVARRRRRLAALSAIAVAMLSARPAAAAERAEPVKRDEAPIDPHDACAHRPQLGVQASFGVSFDHTALAGSIGGRYRINSRWLVGLDVEWNPWGSFITRNPRPGALNVYGTLARRSPLLAERFHLRSTVHLGTSRALFSLYGVPAGTMGVYLGASLLGLEWTMSKTTSIIMDPADIAFPVPQLDGVPFGYLQYRFTVGVQYGG